MSDLTALLKQLQENPNTVEFKQVIDLIHTYYDYHPSEFSNGDTVNAAGTNEGSAKIFAFANLHSLTPLQTLACFGHYYRVDVLEHPEASDHQNIRNFISHGWDGIRFSQPILTAKA